MPEMIIYRGQNGNFGYPPDPVTDLGSKGKDAKIELTWTDPNDKTVDDTFCQSPPLFSLF